jgi:hypothetical protein
MDANTLLEKKIDEEVGGIQTEATIYFGRIDLKL